MGLSDDDLELFAEREKEERNDEDTSQKLTNLQVLQEKLIDKTTAQKADSILANAKNIRPPLTPTFRASLMRTLASVLK